MLFILLKSIHLIALLCLFAASLYKNLLLGSAIHPAATARLQANQQAARLGTLSAALILISGVLLVQLNPQRSALYLDNPLFLLKIAVFIMASLMVAISKAFFFRPRNAGPDTPAEIPPGVRWIIRTDPGWLLLQVLLSVAMLAPDPS